MNTKSDAMHELLPWYVNGTLDPDEAASFEQHLRSCRACRAESMRLRALEQVILEQPRPDPPRTGRSGLVRVLVAVGLFAAGFAVALVFGPEKPRETAILPTFSIDGIQRDMDVPLVEPPANAEEFQLVLFVDVGSDAFPLTLEVTDENEAVVWRQCGIERLEQGGFVFLKCATSNFPDGRYEIAIRSATSRFEGGRYRFRVVRPGGGSGAARL